MFSNYFKLNLSMKKVLFLILFSAAFTLKAQTIPSVLDSIPNPSGSYLDTAYYHVLFAVPNQIAKVQPARVIIRYITYENVPAPKPIEQWWEVVAKGNFQNPSSKVVWAKVPYNISNVVWVERIKTVN